MEGKSLDTVATLKEKLSALIPEAFTEGKIDWEKLKAVLGEDINFSNERYVLNWAGKSDAFKVMQAPTTKTLVPAKDESVNFDETENIFIEGENLEVLKTLQKSYFGKIKMIYIDPPYNTGNDSFIYPDKFSETKEEYQKRVGDKDEEGYMTKDGMFHKNSKENGQYHSNWLNMMYPRLFMAKNLLTEDGVIFVSIDDNEVHNLRLVMNEIFGEENFVECITWNKRVPKNDKGIGNIHEYVLVYLKNAQIDYKFTMPKEGLDEINTLVSKLKKKSTPIKDAESELRKLYKKKGYDRGITLYNSINKNDYRIWGKINVSWPNGDTFGPTYDVLHPISKKPVKVPDRGWRWKEETFADLLDYDNVIELHDGSFMCGKIWFDKGENTQPSLIKFLDEVDNLLLRSILSFKSDGGIEVENIFDGKSYFSYPKPTSIIKTLVHSYKLNDNDIVLDFFSGSGTLGHAVLELNKEDSINRKFICVQLPEHSDKKSEAYKAGFQTIADISKERIRRVIQKIREEQEGKLDFSEGKQDLGFKVFKLSESNFKQWQPKPKSAEELAEQMKLFVNPINGEPTNESMAFELLLKSGLNLNSPIAEKEGFYLINENELALVLEETNESVFSAIATHSPKRVIALDTAFKDNDQLKTNAALQLKDAGIDFKTI